MPLLSAESGRVVPGAESRRPALPADPVAWGDQARAARARDGPMRRLVWPVPGLGGWVILPRSLAQAGKHKPDPGPRGGLCGLTAWAEQMERNRMSWSQKEAYVPAGKRWGAPGLSDSLPPPGHKHSPELVHHPHQHEERVLADTLLECVGKGRELLVRGARVKESHSHTGRAGGGGRYPAPAAVYRALTCRSPGSEAPAPGSYACGAASTALLRSGLPGPPSFLWDLLKRCRLPGWASGGKRWSESTCPEHPLSGTGWGCVAHRCLLYLCPELPPSPLRSARHPFPSAATHATTSSSSPRSWFLPGGAQTLAIPSCSLWTLQALPWLSLLLSRDPRVLRKEPHSAGPRACRRGLTGQLCPGPWCCDVPTDACSSHAGQVLGPELRSVGARGGPSPTELPCGSLRLSKAAS